jgi:predicted RNase H-like HicB family nuclease
MMLNYTVIITKDKGTYVGQCLEVPEAITEASTFEELLLNLKDAISIIIEVKK